MRLTFQSLLTNIEKSYKQFHILANEKKLIKIKNVNLEIKRMKINRDYYTT